jgi:hypothetical protein
MKFDLGDVLTRMWKIGWNHKVLWLWQILPGMNPAVHDDTARTLQSVC